MKEIVSLNERCVHTISLTWGNSHFEADLLLPPAAFWWFRFLHVFLMGKLSSLSEET